MTTGALAQQQIATDSGLFAGRERTRSLHGSPAVVEGLQSIETASKG